MRGLLAAQQGGHTPPLHVRCKVRSARSQALQGGAYRRYESTASLLGRPPGWYSACMQG